MISKGSGMRIEPPTPYTLGLVAYEAYCRETGWKSAITGADLPQFNATPELVQQAWIAAAEAVRAV